MIKRSKNKNFPGLKRIFIFSYDAFANYDWEAAAKLPNLSKLIEKSSYSQNVISTNPSITYVAHTTMMTGLEPNQHLIGHNKPLQPFQPESLQKWNWYDKEIAGDTLYDLLQKDKKRVASILWPVTAKAKIRYNLPEVHAIGRENQSLKVLLSGSPLYCIEMSRRFGHLRRGIEQPYLDDFTAASAIYTWQKYQPELLLLHQIELDTINHHFGTGGAEVQKSRENMDRRIGQVFQAIKDAGFEDETAFVIIGDHSHLDSHTTIYLNRLLALLGLIEAKKKKPNWRAWFQSTGGGAYLHLPEGEEYLLPLITEVLHNFKNRYKDSINRILNREEMDAFQMIKGPQLFVEGCPGFVFDDTWLGLDTEASFFGPAQGSDHGYLNDLPGYRSNVLFKGPWFKEDFEFGQIDLADFAVTLAYLFDYKLQGSRGRVIEEIFK